jgi:Zn-dependent protease
MITAGRLILLYYAAALIHELAHAAVSECCGLPVKGLRFSWGSIGIVRPVGRPAANLFVSLAGPAMSLLVAWLAWPHFRTFGLANLLIGALNLLPMRGSDGGRVLGCLKRLHWI